MREINLATKRFMDIMGSLMGIVLCSPLLIIIAIMIKATSQGPVLYTQERLGKNGRVFRIVKFRTMVVNAEHLGSGVIVKSELDDRITKIGKFLRATSMDELPQLWNVLIGEMSLVGPRPPVPYHPYKYDEYNALQRKRFAMNPGVTGLTQVTVRNSVPWDERIPIDVEYVEKFTVWLDIKILLKTIRKVFNRESIYIRAADKRSNL